MCEILEKLLCKYITYKFIFNNNINKSSYTYQKLFRSIYGYNQSIYKRNSKKYIYFREGVISSIPYIKSGKNSVILPIDYEHKLIDYFNTGNNPAHKWKIKGDWDVSYAINDIHIDLFNISVAMEKFIRNYKIFSNDFKSYNYIEFELKKFFESNLNNYQYKEYLISNLKYLFDFEWIYKSINYSEYIKNIYNKYLLLKENSSE